MDVHPESMAIAVRDYLLYLNTKCLVTAVGASVVKVMILPTDYEHFKAVVGLLNSARLSAKTEWHIYEVTNCDPFVMLTYQPVSHSVDLMRNGGKPLVGE